ncbi:MAG: TraB/GumN family protein [Nitrospirae bacterium]|nr:MAG: TraB/GumN family protein [Nitrospirota bacterium]
MNISRIKKLSLFTAVALICLFVYIPSTCYGGNNFLWKVRSKTNTLYLLGSIHSMKQDVYPLSKTIEDSFARSSVLAVEANINDLEKVNPMLLALSVAYPDGEGFEKHVSAKTADLVKARMSESGLPYNIMSRYKAWVLGITLASMELDKLGYKPEYGIDSHFLTKSSGSKRVVELESIEFQLNLFNDLSDAEQEVLLLSSVKDRDALKEDMEQLITAWRTGNTKAVERLTMKELAAQGAKSELGEKLLFARNRSMTYKIEAYLNSNETYFVVVGAGHLVGDKGIVQLLRQKGYAVEQM